jgi:flagellar motor protein MotB
VSALQCPVCPHGAAVPDGATVCPICGTDLEVLARLARVRESIDTAAAVPIPVVAPRRVGGLAAACVLGGAVLGGGIAAMLIGVTRPADATPPVAASIPVSAPSTATPAKAATPDALDDLTARLTRAGGVKVQRSGDRVVVGFQDAIFRRGTARLDPAARRLIEGLASELWQTGNALRIDIIGHTDPASVRAGAQWSDNWALGLSRAEAVAVVLHRARRNDAPATNIHVASAGESVPELETEAGARRTAVIAATLAPRR